MMFNADTNVLVRAFLSDDKEQSKKAQDFMEQASKEGKLFISSYALLEFVWVLKTKKFTRQEIYEAIITLTDTTGVMIGQREVVLAAADKYLKGKADFGDYMSIIEGERKGVHQMRTFDNMILAEFEHAFQP